MDLDKNSFESKDQLSQLFERLFIFSGPRGFRQKKPSNKGLNEVLWDKMKLNQAIFGYIISYRAKPNGLTHKQSNSDALTTSDSINQNIA